MTTTQQRFTPESIIAGRIVAPYTPPTPSPFVDLALDANEGAPADEGVLDAVRALTAEDLRRYPDARGLEREIAARFGVDPARVVVTNGADDAIDRVCRAFLTPGRVMATHAPSFEMIERSARLVGAEVRNVDWADGRFPRERFVESIDGSVALAALVSPNNPTGGSIPTDDLRSIARAAASNGAVVLADLAYVEFADADPTPDLLREPNVVIVRTFSKAMGLAGLRIGYAIVPPDLANALRAAGGPYPVSSISLAAASSALRGGERRRGFIDRLRDERERLTETLRSAGVAALDSQANFVAARFR
ncbi:MAG: pyridoxal phosphate-dependent aminotransferase, partial [Phycisphaerales bacterium]